MAREDDRNRVAVHDLADRAGGAWISGASGKRPVGRRRPILDARELFEDDTVVVGKEADVDLEVEVAALAGKVLVELAAYPVDRLRGTQHAGAEAPREDVEVVLRLRVE